MLSSNPGQAPTSAPSASPNPASNFRTLFAATLLAGLATAGCQDSTEEVTVPNPRPRTEQAAPVSPAMPTGSPDKYCDENNEYERPACHYKPTRDNQVEVPCFIAKNATLKAVREAYASLFADALTGYDPQHCNPYELPRAADAVFHNWIKIRHLSKHPGQIVEHNVKTDNLYIAELMAKYAKEQEAAFGTRRRRALVGFQEKCFEWDADSMQKELPKSCLLVLDHRVPKTIPSSL